MEFLEVVPRIVRSLGGGGNGANHAANHEGCAAAGHRSAFKILYTHMGYPLSSSVSGILDE
jgi:hypothetical protein